MSNSNDLPLIEVTSVMVLFSSRVESRHYALCNTRRTKAVRSPLITPQGGVDYITYVEAGVCPYIKRGVNHRVSIGGRRECIFTRNSQF